MTGTVYVNQANPRQRQVPGDIRKAIDPRIDVVLVGDPWSFPKAWNFYITRAALNAKTEAAAAEMNVPIVSMPAAAGYLAGKVLALAEAGDDVWLWQANVTGARP